MSTPHQPAEKLRTVKLYGPLGAQFGREHQFYVNSAAEAVRALNANFQAFAEFLQDTKYQYAILVGKRHLNLNINLDELRDPPGNGDIRIVPVIAGAKRGGLFQTILGAALIALSFIPVTAPLAVAAASMAFSVGVGLTLGGVAQLLSPQPKLNMGGAENRASEYFNGPAQTIGQGNPVPIFYGEGIIGSVPISAGIYADDSH